MTFRVNWWFAGLLPLALALGLLVEGVRHYTSKLVVEQTAALEAQMLASRRETLQHHVALALGALSSLENGQGSLAERQALAKGVLGKMLYGANGYLFVYDAKGTCVVHTAMPELVGRSFDQSGTRSKIASDLIETARRGGGFERYVWPKPPAGREVEKLSYAALFAPWGWTIGTGAYLDDIAMATASLRTKETRFVRESLWRVGLTAAFAVGLAFAGAMTLYMAERRRAERQLLYLNQRLVELQEEERAHISRELHDGVSQLIVAAKFEFEAIERSIEAELPEAVSGWQSGLRRLSDALREVRDMSHRIRPPDLDDLGLALALKAQVSEFEKRSKIVTNFGTSGETSRLSEAQTIALFRIAQEALRNVERHAGASHVNVELAVLGTRAHLKVTDDGRGFAPSLRKKSAGIGLRNMKQRVAHLGGELIVLSVPGETSIFAVLPLVPENSA